MKRLPIFVMLLIPIALFPQERINAPLPVISNPITELSFAKRWMYDSSTERWNVQNNSVVDITDGVDFVKYEFRKVEYKDKKFIVFLVYYKNVYWDYPEIYVGAHHVITLNYFLIDEDEYLNKISTLTDSIGSIQIRLFSKGINVDSKYLQKMFAADINYTKNSDSECNYLLILHRNIESKNRMQFLIFTQGDFNNSANLFHSYGRCLYFYLHGALPINIDLNTDSIFNQFYYETTLSNFLNVFNLSHNL